jgi:sugar phosphate isomerase/epimerase
MVTHTGVRAATPSQTLLLLLSSHKVAISRPPFSAVFDFKAWTREAAVFVACSTLCFARYLEFSKVDVAIHESGPHIRPSEVAADLSLAAQRVRIGPSLSPAAFNVEIEADNEPEYHRQLLAICHLARLSTVPVITIPAAATGNGLDGEVERLTNLARVVQAEGIVLTVETRMGTLTEYPEAAVELCRRVPGLGLTLDPSHYIAGPHQGKSYDQVFPFVRHVHLRDTGRRAEQFQVRVGQGEIEYGRIVSQLARVHYDRLLTVEICDIPDAPFAMDAEVRKLKYLLESLV